MHPRGVWTVIAYICLMFPLPLRADRLLLIDGRTLEGEIQEESGDTITLEIRRSGSKLLQRIPKNQIRTWYRRSTEGEPYVTLPISGVIGEDITPRALRAGFDQARASGAKYVILAINSPGGNVAAMVEMVDDVLAESRQMHVIAYVKQAYSAAAVIAMACRQVYMTPDGAIGAVVPFRMTNNGPAEVDAKFRSAFQAKIRATAALADHADLVIRGMSELDLEIVLTHEEGRPILRTSGEGKRIKSKGQILSLTAAEAEECGLAKTAPTITALGLAVAGGPWHEVDRRAWNAVVDTVAAQRRREQAEQARAQRLLQRKAAVERIKPEYDSLVRRAVELRSKVAAHEIEMDKIKQQYQAAVKQAQEEYDRAMAQAQDRNNTAAMNMANQVRDSRMAMLQKKLAELISTPESQANSAAIEAAAIEARLDELLASIPPE